MPNIKISALTALTGANTATDDEYVVVDKNVPETKKQTRAELFLNMPDTIVNGTTVVGGAKLTSYASSASTRAIAACNDFTSDEAAAPVWVQKKSTTNTTSQVFVQFAVNAGATANGQINANGASQAAFGSYSDIRLKENVEDLPSQLDNIKALRPVEFDYIDGSGHQIGFIAQELQLIYPDTVTANADGMLSVTGWSKTEARLVKALQEADAKITALESRIAALEA